MTDPSLTKSIGAGLIPCNVNGIIVNFDADTGSNANIFGWDDFKAYCKLKGSTPKLRVATRTLADASNGSMAVAGCFRARLSSQHNSCQDTIYVLKHATKYDPLLSEDTLLRLGFVRYDVEGAFAEINRHKPVKNPKKRTNNVHKLNNMEKEKDCDDDISEDQFQAEWAALLKKFKKVFIGVGEFKNYKISLTLNEDATPFVHKACNVAIHLRPMALERLQYFEKIGVMQKLPPNYPIKFLSPLLVVPKPGKEEVRLVANFKLLNLRLRRTNESPATKLEDFMQKTRGSKYFFKLDLKHGYHQMVLTEESQELCLVATFNGTYKYTRLPMGVISAGDEFDRAIQITLADCSNTISNRDDILGGSKTRKGLLRELRKVLSCLQKAGLTCDPSKTQVGLTSIKFFGMIFSAAGMKPDSDKITALVNSPRPNDQKSLLSFICSCGWNMTFLPRFAELVAPLRTLAKTKGPFRWTEAHEKSFQELKVALAKDCLNNTYYEDRTTLVYADAGKMTHDKSEPGGFSAILVQIEPKTGRPLIIHYASRTISTTEAKWAQVELEARAIRYGLDKFRFYLEGHPGFTVMTDCKPLVPLFNKVPLPKSCPPRIARQIIALQDLSYTLEHCPGSRNIADWTSRCPLFDGSDVQDYMDSAVMDYALIRRIHDQRECDAITIHQIKTATASDEELQFLINRINNNDFYKHRNNPIVKPFTGIQHDLSIVDGIIFYGDSLIVVPKSLRHVITEATHRLAHAGETNTEALIRDHFFWPGISSFVKKTLSSCSICSQITRKPPTAPAGITYTPENPHEEVSVDFKGPTHDGKYVLVFIDLFSRYPEVYFTSSTSFASNKNHFINYFSANGPPVYLKTDGGPPFNSYEFKEFLDRYEIKHKSIIPAHPESNAEVETFMRTLNKAIKVATLKNTNYKEEIMAAVQAKRATPHPATGVSPFEAVHGYKMNPGIIAGALPTKKSIGTTRQQRKKIQENIIDSKIKTKLRHDKKKNVHFQNLREGDRVYVRLDRHEMPLPHTYTITRINRTDVTAKSDSGHTVRRHINHFQLATDTPGTSCEPQLSDDPPDPDTNHQVIHDIPHGIYVQPRHGDNPDVLPPPTQAAQQIPQRPNRFVHFNPRVQVRGPSRSTRSSGPAPDLPNVMTAPLERSAQARAEAERILQEHEEQQ